MRKFNDAIVMMLLGVMICTQAKAAEFCATTSQELQSALDTARDNGQNDFIRIATGSYEGGFSYGGAEDFDLTIMGGFTEFFGNPCGQRTGGPFETILDGDTMDQVFLLQAFGDSDIKISYLTFINGIADRGAGLEVRTFENFVGDVLVEYTAFINNEGNFSSALTMSRGRKLTVRNSVFVANESTVGTGTVNMISNDRLGVYFNNNTMINNTMSGTGNASHAGLRVFTSGSSKIFVANNLMQGNEGADVRVSSGGDTSYFYNNNVGSIIGAFDVVDRNISSAPIFEGGFFNYTPALESGEVNKGRRSPTIVPIPIPFEFNWSIGSTDFNGNPRVQDGRVDIGAFEAVPEIPIFENGFDPLLISP